MVEVLRRLPERPLCRFKCVCRSWRDLISGPVHRRRLALTNAASGFFYHVHANATITHLGFTPLCPPADDEEEGGGGSQPPVAVVGDGPALDLRQGPLGAAGLVQRPPPPLLPRRRSRPAAAGGRSLVHRLQPCHQDLQRTAPAAARARAEA